MVFVERGDSAMSLHSFLACHCSAKWYDKSDPLFKVSVFSIIAFIFETMHIEVSYPDLSIHEVCAVENMWRDRIQITKYISLVRIFMNKLPLDIIKKIAWNGEYRAIEANRSSTKTDWTLVILPATVY